MPDTMQYTGTLVIQKCWCGIIFAAPSGLVHEQQRQHNDGERQIAIHCPLGHSGIIAGRSEVDKARWETEQARKSIAAVQARLDQANAEARNQREEKERVERSLKSTRGVVTRVKNRIAKGKRPCCSRSFADLHSHMTEKHPGYGAESVTA